MPYSDDLESVSEYSFAIFNETSFDPAEIEGYVPGVVTSALLGITDKVVTLDNGNRYSIRYENKLIKLGTVTGTNVTWSPITLVEYDILQGVPDIINEQDIYIITWAEGNTIHVYEKNEYYPTPTEFTFDGVSSAICVTSQFGICICYMGLDGCIHIRERGVSEWTTDWVMSADLADSTIRIIRAFVCHATTSVTERIALLMVREAEGSPDYFYMVSNIEPYGGGSGSNTDLSSDYQLSLSSQVTNLGFVHATVDGYTYTFLG